MFLDIRRHVRCRMYDGYRASFNGISKNIYDLARNRSLLFAAAVTLLVTFVVLPLALLPVQILTGIPGADRSLLCVALFLAAWALVLYDRGLRWWAPFLYPVLFVHLLYMAWWSFAQCAHGPRRGLEGTHPALGGRPWHMLKGRASSASRPQFLPFFFLFHFVLALVRLFDWLVYRISIKGRENLRGVDRAILVSNHTLLLDPGIIAHAISPRRTYFTMLEETALIPLLGTFVRLLGGVPIPERPDALRTLDAAAHARRRRAGIHPFLPRRRMLPGQPGDPMPFHPGAFLLACRLACRSSP